MPCVASICEWLAAPLKAAPWIAQLPVNVFAAVAGSSSRRLA